MNKFRKPHGGGGNHSFGGGGQGRPSFGRPSRPPFAGAREESGQKFDAICAKCAKKCQVPFQPNGKKPVYCRDCFGMQRQDTPHQENFVRRDAPAVNRDFPKRPFESHESHVEDRAIADLKRQMDILTSKVDVIMRMLQDAPRATAPTAVIAAPSPAVLPRTNPKGTFRADAAKKKVAKKKGPAKK